MSQYSLERKESVVRRMLSPTTISMAELARETGISEATLYLWRNRARIKGEGMTGQSKNPAKWPSAKKFAVVVETASFNEAELGEYCRKHGLYTEQVKAWRAACEKANATAEMARAIREAVAAEKRRSKALERELRRKEKALAETAALLTLRKKAAAIWGEGEDE